MHLAFHGANELLLCLHLADGGPANHGRTEAWYHFLKRPEEGIGFQVHPGRAVDAGGEDSEISLDLSVCLFGDQPVADHGSATGRATDVLDFCSENLRAFFSCLMEQERVEVAVSARSLLGL